MGVVGHCRAVDASNGAGQAWICCSGAGAQPLRTLGQADPRSLARVATPPRAYSTRCAERFAIRSVSQV